ncbi:MAG: maleylpyruvate isomerase N-terminal domain-containing protein, partial [Pseudomonadota bacterium]
MLTQADDFLAESEALHTLIAPLDGRALTQVTQFKGWTIEDVILHLHFWNGAADLATQNPKTFRTLIT